MNLFTIQLQPLGQARRHALRQIRIAARDAVFTRLLREPGNQLDDWLQAEPAPLAYWLCDHWWRLRWEGVPTNGPSPDWRLSHDVAATGGGYAWPRLSIWGDVDRIGLHSQADPAGVVGPVRYLTDALVYVDAGEFEAEVDRFLAQVAAEHRENGAEPIALEALIAALTAERQDPEVARWRRLEARLGYDPDAGPDDLIASADTLATRWGLEAVEEAICATPGSMATETLAGEVSYTQQYGQACDFSAILTGIEPVPRNACAPPWVAAEESAARVRALAGIQRGPLRNTRLADLLATTTKAFKGQPPQPNLAYGLRLGTEGNPGPQTIALRSAPSAGRRFELCRALGDALWSRHEPLGPLAKTSTARQKFQRTFAQSLLCPFDELMAYLGQDQPDEDAIAAAADHFHVGERVVQTVLRNKDVIPRQRFEDWVEAA